MSDEHYLDALGEGLGETETDEGAEDYGPEIPPPVEVTDAVYQSLAEKGGQDQTMRLQSYWNDKAWNNSAVADAVLKNHTELNSIASEYGIDGGIEGEGADRIIEYFAKQDGFEDPLDFLRSNPEIQAIFLDDYDEQSGYLPMAGFLRMLAYLGTRLGYKHPYREERK